MATAPISREGHKQLLSYIKEIWSMNRGFYYSELIHKLRAIDRAYYVYKEKRKKGYGVEAADEQCSASLKRDNITLPIAVADADTAASNLADIFLMGNPIFGVVAPPDSKDIIPAWEALFQYYSKPGRWVPELYNCFMAGIKYNMPVIEVDWNLTYEFNPSDDLTTVQRQAQMSPVPHGVLTMHSPDVYNMLWDVHVRPSDLATLGAYAGHNRLFTRTQLKSMFAAIALDARRKQYTMNIKEAFDSNFPANYYNWKPPISQFIVADKTTTNWVEWSFARDQGHIVDQANGGRSVRYNNTKDIYLVTKLFLKVIPSEFHIKTGHENIPRIYKAYVVNREQIVYLEPVFTPQNTLPIMLGDLQDDWFEYQSFSEVEKLFPYQDAATELVNTRLNSAARALGDRAVYDPEFFNEGDINTTEVAAKIPLKKSLRMDAKSIDQVYRQQPYDHGSTAGVMSDVEAMMGFARMHSGRNEFMQGQNRKGNRTLGEFQQVMGQAQVRNLRIPLRIEHMIMGPLKAHIKAQLMQNVTDTDLINTKTKKLMSISASDLRRTLVEFKLTTGLVNKAMYVNPELLITGLQTLQANPELQQRFDVVEWFSYIMLMGGVPDVDQFEREPVMPAAAPGSSPAQPGTPAAAPPGQPPGRSVAQ